MLILMPWKLMLLLPLETPKSSSVSVCSVNLLKRLAVVYIRKCVTMVFNKLQVLVRMRQYKDELLSSCLQLLLSLPRQLVQVDIAALIPALQVHHNHNNAPEHFSNKDT